jgi:hypothetical protein
LWKAIEEGEVPVLLEKDKAGEDILCTQSFCSILDLLSKVMTHRYHYCMDSFIEYRHHLYRELDQPGGLEKYKRAIVAIDSCESKLREEALSYMLYKLRLPYEVMRRSLEFYGSQKDKRTIEDWFTLIKENSEWDAMYTRDQMLHAT